LCIASVCSLYRVIVDPPFLSLLCASLFSPPPREEVFLRGGFYLHEYFFFFSVLSSERSFHEADWACLPLGSLLQLDGTYILMLPAKTLRSPLFFSLLREIYSFFLLILPVFTNPVRSVVCLSSRFRTVSFRTFSSVFPQLCEKPDRQVFYLWLLLSSSSPVIRCPPQTLLWWSS